MINEIIRKIYTQMMNNKWTVNNIGDEGAKKISGSLMINTTLTELNVNGVDDRWRSSYIAKYYVKKEFIKWIK